MSEYLAGTVTNVPDPENYGGACNLGSLILPNFVIHPFTKEAYIDWTQLQETISIAVEMLDRIIDINKFPDKIYENYQKRFRTIGLGVTGLADALVMLNLKYNTQEARDFTSTLMEAISFYAYSASEELAETKGKFLGFTSDYINNGWLNKERTDKFDWNGLIEKIRIHGIRNAKILSVAPTGTMSLTFGNNCSSGIEPIFSLEYERKVKFGGQSDENIKVVKVRDFAYDKWLDFKDSPNCIVTEDKFVTALNMSVNDHVDMLAVIARNVDMSVSKTINIPTDYSFEDTKEVYVRCWQKGIKGCTIFRPNEIRQGILVTEETKNNVNKVSLNRGDWKPLAEDTVYYKKKLKIGCGSLKLFIGWSESEQAIQDIYIKKSGSGGCERLEEAVAITMSAILRLGGNVCNIKKAFSGLGACNSFTSARKAGTELSRGNSCGMVILNAMEDFVKEHKKDFAGCENHNSQNKENIVINQNIENIKLIKDDAHCPECGREVVHIGGCVQCTCGWSKCE